MKTKILSLLVGLLLVSQANAQGLTLGNAGYGGSGCPAGTASVILSPDQQELSILFDSYMVEAGGVTGKRVDRKNCAITVPVHVPQGFSVAIFKVDYRGFNSVPVGGRNQFDAEYFWAGTRGPRITKTFTGPQTDNFTLTNELLASTYVWSACGDSVNLRVNTSMMTQTNYRNDQSLATVDSADLSSAVVYHIRTRRCY